MNTLPEEVRIFLLSRADARMLADLLEKDPALEDRMTSLHTRRQLWSWLDTEEAHGEEYGLLTAAALQFLQSVRDEAEAAVVGGLIEHPSAMVRLRSFEALLIPLFAERGIENMKGLLRDMLADNDDLVRSAGARYIQRTAVVDGLRPFLLGWRAAAPDRGWAATESFEIVNRLLGEP